MCAAGESATLEGGREKVLAEARGAAILGERGRARAIYLALLARRADDDEALAGLARVDAWDGCWELAARGYRSVLARHPGDAEVRAGLVDLLLWQHRWDEAETELAEGLERAPGSPDLLARRAQLAHRRGDEEGAVRDSAAAARLSLDPTFRAQREQFFLGEARIGARVQLFPKGYDDVYTTDAEVMQRYRHFRFQVGHQLVTRTGALGQPPITDGRRALGVYYHSRSGGWAGLDVAFTSPAIALPRWAFTLSGLAPLGSRFSLFLAAAVWRYATDKTVLLVAPSLGVAFTDTLEIGVRWWVSSVVTNVPGQPVASDTVHSAGLRAVFRPDPAVIVGAEYTYGVQLDQNPTIAQFLVLRSHILTVFARRMLTSQIGIQPVLTLERRENARSGDIIVVPAAEVSALARW